MYILHENWTSRRQGTLTHSKALILLGTGLKLIAELSAYIIDGYNVAIHVVPALVASSWLASYSYESRIT